MLILVHCLMDPFFFSWTAAFFKLRDFFKMKLFSVIVRNRKILKSARLRFQHHLLRISRYFICINSFRYLTVSQCFKNYFFWSVIHDRKHRALRNLNNIGKLVLNFIFSGSVHVIGRLSLKLEEKLSRKLFSFQKNRKVITRKVNTLH